MIEGNSTAAANMNAEKDDAMVTTADTEAATSTPAAVFQLDSSGHLERLSTPSSEDANVGGAVERKERDTNGSGVSFGTVRVHTHRMTLGDNPSVTGGVPVTIGWEVDDSETFQIDEYDKSHSEQHDLRKIARNRREHIALERHTRNSIVRVEEEVNDIKSSRIHTEKYGARPRREEKPKTNILSRMFGSKK